MRPRVPATLPPAAALAAALAPLVALLLALLALSLLARPAGAIPVFARKYGFACTMCHSAMPRLNDFGTRFRANGYQLPGMEATEKTVLEGPAPIALRTSAGYVGQNFNASARDLGAEEESDFRLEGLDLLSAGVLGRHVGYFLVYQPQITATRGVAPQEGNLETANVIFRRIGDSPWLNLRVGRFEPAYVAFSVKRQLTVNTPTVYEAAFPGGPAPGGTQSGIELTGHGSSPFQYACGLVDGSNTNLSIDSPSDLYARAAWTFGPGEGQTAGQRIGVTGYFGQARPEASGDRSPFYRVGADASLNAGIVNLALQWSYERDDQALWGDFGATDDVDWWGGFGEITVMPQSRLAAFGRFDLLNLPDVDDQDVTRLTAGARYYFENNIAWHSEISYAKAKSLVDGVDDPSQTYFTTRVDFAF